MVENWYSVTSSADGTKLVAAYYGTGIYTIVRGDLDLAILRRRLAGRRLFGGRDQTGGRAREWAPFHIEQLLDQGYVARPQPWVHPEAALQNDHSFDPQRANGEKKSDSWGASFVHI